MTIAPGPANDEPSDYLGVLDGMRALMAFWVFYEHAQLDVVGHYPRWGPAAYAVDVFMFLSGFLMMYHWKLREDGFQSMKSQTIDFYVRRLFRIAPLYYLLLLVALVMQTPLLEMSEQIAAQVPLPFAKDQAAFASPTDTTITVASVLAHLTFFFGFVPKFAANNVLPDWSIGLEMQFYVFLPLLIVLIKRAGPLSLVMASLAAAFIVGKLVGLYLSSGPLGNFPQPSLLLFKLNVFVAGMCVARAYLVRRERRSVPWIAYGAIAMAGLAPIVVVFIAFMTLLLFFDDGVKQGELVHRLLSGRVARFFGDTSYAMYLSHKLVLVPATYLLLRQAWFISMGSGQKMIVTLLVAGIPVYLISYALHRLIELPGIAIGKRALGALRARQLMPKVGAI